MVNCLGIYSNSTANFNNSPILVFPQTEEKYIEVFVSVGVGSMHILFDFRENFEEKEAETTGEGMVQGRRKRNKSIIVTFEFWQ